MRFLIHVIVLVTFFYGHHQHHATADDQLQIATFSIDITPRLGKPVGQGFIPVLKTAEHPLLARGILLKDSCVSCVLCTLDLMEVHGDAYDLLRRTIASAAGVPESQVALHCLHQHTAPAIDTNAQRLELSEEHQRRVATSEYLAHVSAQLTTAVREAQENWRTINEVGVGKGKVLRVASNRRLELADGTIQVRSSSTKNAAHLRELPEGLIDPWVRTISFALDGRAIAQVHYYATHPQSFYGDGRATYDVPGIVRERLEKKSKTFQLYFTGCGGDVAFGKYNDGSRRARSELVDRLQRGIEQSIQSLKYEPAAPMKWSVEQMSFSTRKDEPFSRAANQKIVDDKQASAAARRKAAIAIAWIDRVEAGTKVELSCLSMGRVQLLHLPGEAFVQYQLAAQKMQPKKFVCVASYGDCAMGYIGGDRIYSDRGGYEQTYAFSGRCEKELMSTIKRLLAK